MRRARSRAVLLAMLGSAILALNSPADAEQAVNGLNMMKRDLCHSFKLDCRKRHASSPARRPPAAAVPATPRKGAAKPPAAAAKPPTPVAKPQPPTEPAAAPEAARPAVTTAAPVPRARPVVPEAQPPVAKAPAPPAEAASTFVPVPRERPVLLPSLPPVTSTVTAAPAPAEKTPDVQSASIAPSVPAAGPPDCEQALRTARVQFESVPASFGEAGCPVADPVRLHAVETPSGTVSFPEAPVFNCRFARQFASWVADTGSAVVLAQMNKRLEKVATGPGYDCRHRNGDSSAKMSEHAAGDAVDITSMTVEGGGSIRMADALNPRAPSFAVLRALRTTACGYFTTVLGPGANEAHKEHFHLDLGVHGKSANYRICE